MSSRAAIFADLGVGVSVELTGLNANELNGARAVITGFDPRDAERYGPWDMEGFGFGN